MRRFANHLLVCVTLSAAAMATEAVAGTEYEIEVTDHRRSKVGADWLRVEGLDLRLELAQRTRKDRVGALIFRGERAQPRLIVSDGTGGHVIVDQDAIGRLAAEAPRPGPAGAVESGELEYVERGIRERQGYPCLRYDVLRDGVKIREICATDWALLEGGRQTGKALAAFGEFYRELRASLAGMPEHSEAILGRPQSLVEDILRLGRFPVTTGEFENGELVRSSVLKSAREVDHPPGTFKPDPRSVDRPFG